MANYLYSLPDGRIVTELSRERRPGGDSIVATPEHPNHPFRVPTAQLEKAGEPTGAPAIADLQAENARLRELLAGWRNWYAGTAQWPGNDLVTQTDAAIDAATGGTK